MSTAAKYRKKPVVIEAVQFTDNASAERIAKWAGTPPLRVCFRPDMPHVAEMLAVDTLEGTMTADLGDWIVRGTEGEFYPVKPGAFAATFEPVETPDE
jgi:hypothetical protein